jgi:hypothetical protein
VLILYITWSYTEELSEILVINRKKLPTRAAGAGSRPVLRAGAGAAATLAGGSNRWPARQLRRLIDRVSLTAQSIA